MIVQTTPASTSGDSTSTASSDARVAVAIPIPNDPDWTLFDAIPADVPILVIDDSDGRLQPPPRDNVRYYDYAAQEAVMGANYAAIPHKSAATRNFAHYLAALEGFDVVVALDYDCRTRPGWLETHLGCLGFVANAPALAGAWINSVEAPGFFARGYPYEYRNDTASHVTETHASGEVKVNMGVWDNVLDLNGIDKLQAEPPTEPGLRGEQNYVALGNVPVCGMNTAFTADVIPAYFFLPDVWVDGTWQLSRHDDIWGGYILKRLMDVRGDLLSYGRPVVEHTRQSKIEHVVVIEHYMHLMSMQFYAIVEQAVARVRAADYATMFADFTEEYRKEAARAAVPEHFRQAFRELGDAMHRWVRCFS
jgi:hypothetical protein